jgi:hypothetical protein
MDLSALTGPRPGRAVSGLTEPNVALTRCGLVYPLRSSADRSSLRSLAEHRPRIIFGASLLANRFYSTSCLEQSAMTQHGMHDYCEPASKRDTGLLKAAALGDLKSPCLQGKGLPAACEDRVGRLVEQLADGLVALLGDPAGPVEFSRLVASGHQAEVGAGIARLSEATRFRRGRSVPIRDAGKP